MAKKDVDVRFNLIDNFTASFNKTIGTLTAGTKKAQNAWKSVEKFGNGISSLGTKATAAVTMPLVGLAAASATEFGSVDKSLVGIFRFYRCGKRFGLAFMQAERGRVQGYARNGYRIFGIIVDRKSVV